MRFIQSKSKVQYLFTVWGFFYYYYQQLELSEMCTSGRVSHVTHCLTPESCLHPQPERQQPSSCPPRLL